MAVGELRGGEKHFLSTPTPLLEGRAFDDIQREVRKLRGFYPSGGMRTLPPDSLRRLKSEHYLPAEGASEADPYPITPAFDDGVRNLSRELYRRHITLLIRLTPVLQGASEEHFDRIATWYDKLESEFPNVICDRPEVLIYGPEYIADVFNHINVPGAEKFTAWLAQRVTRLLSQTANRPAAAAAPDQATTTARSQAD
jgi:hypothetical protein